MNHPDIEPMHDYVLVRIERQTETAGGIVLPDAHQGVLRAKVLAVGPGRVTLSGERIACGCSVGDYVLPAPNASMCIVDDDHALVKSDALLAVDRRESLEAARIVTREPMQPRVATHKPYGGRGIIGGES